MPARYCAPLLLQELEEVIRPLLRMHQRKLLDDGRLQLLVLLAARELDERFRVALNEERVDDLLADLGTRVALVDLHQRRAGAAAAHQPEIPDSGELEIEVLLVARDLVELLAVAADEHRLQDLFPPLPSRLEG